VTSGNFNILTTGRGVQFGVGNAGANQTVSYDEIRMGSSLDAVLPLKVPTSAVVSLTASRALAPEPVAGNDAPGEIKATRTGSTASALSVALAVSGTASAGADFSPIGSLVFPPGEDTVTFAIQPFTDAIAESDETVILNLAIGADYTLGDDSGATVTITDRPFGMDSSKSRFIQKMDAGIPQKIVVYGTSLTAAGQWSSQMLTALQASYPGLLTLVNSGGSGMESNWGVANLQTRVLDHNPDVVFIEFSVNDAVDRFKLTLARANANLVTMMNGIKAAKPDCEIILQVMNPVIDRPEGNAGWRPNLHLYQQAYREIGKQNRLLVIDHMPAWQAVLDEGDAIYRGFVSDGLHPGAEGYQRFVTPAILQSVGHAAMAAPTLILDNPSAVANGAWTNSATTPGFYGADYLHDGDAGKGTKSVIFTPQIPAAGKYAVYLRWTADTNRASNVPVTITHTGGTTVVSVNQRLSNGVWVLLGAFDFAAGNSGNIRIDTTATNGFVIADAVGIGVPGGLPAVMLRGDNGRAAEPTSSASAGRHSRVIISRTGPTTAHLTVGLSISGSASQGTDYEAFPASMVIPAGASSAFLSLAPVGDALPEGEESFRIAIIPDAGNYTLATPVKALIVIEDRPFDGWRFRNFTVSQLADPLVSGDLADADGDGLGNLLEFFTGRHPQTTDSQGASRGGSVMVGGEVYQTLTYDKRAASGLIDSVEISTDLLDWQSGVSLLERSILADDGLGQVIRVRSRAPLGSGQTEFLRLKVVREP
jgi:lysophospholipase L1-like esterase